MSAAALASSPITVVGPGNETCGRWLEARRDGGTREIAFGAWLGGYLSAINQYGGGGDILNGMRLEDARLFVDNYCREYPIRTVKHAADALIISLKS